MCQYVGGGHLLNRGVHILFLHTSLFASIISHLLDASGILLGRRCVGSTGAPSSSVRCSLLQMAI